MTPAMPNPFCELSPLECNLQAADKVTAAALPDAPGAAVTTLSRAKATRGKAGMAAGTASVRRSTAGTGLRVGEADAVLPATEEFMAVTARRDGQPILSSDGGLGIHEPRSIMQGGSNATTALSGRACDHAKCLAVIGSSSTGGVESRHTTSSGSGPLSLAPSNGDACSALEPPRVTETVGRQQKTKRAAGIAPGPVEAIPPEASGTACKAPSGPLFGGPSQYAPEIRTVGVMHHDVAALEIGRGEADQRSRLIPFRAAGPLRSMLDELRMLAGLKPRKRAITSISPYAVLRPRSEEDLAFDLAVGIGDIVDQIAAERVPVFLSDPSEQYLDALRGAA